MKGNFADNNDQVRRLMEVIGGSVDAYERPAAPQNQESVPQPEQPPQKPNPFQEPR